MDALKNTPQKLLQYMDERKSDELLALFANDVDWDIPGNTKEIPWLGPRKSKDEIKDFYNLLWLNTEPLEAGIHKIMSDENHAVIIGEFKTLMTATGKVVESFFCIHITVENGLISRYRLFENSFAVAKAMAMKPV
ncbi:nuclear transport factor 2 family protein [Fulvivirga ulvae]|uniref:nuclear transport factor 2 family protein n=1 Tax=Fulvivirga ulvae TaxID=2904245 RepID=UPI001F288F1E|nr:nuclear transport factor 2 family protein [Fulvivirga ulvae]UII31902.1 nuclear transport factor 2 family protein [Fulvivirga ulvae]